MRSLTLGMACIEEGGKKRLVFINANKYHAMVAQLGVGEELQAKFSQQRDVKHNSKLHGVLSEVADALGWETDEFKEFIVTKLRPLGEDKLTGWMRRQSTADMSDEEIDQLVMEVKAWTQHQMPGFVFRIDAEMAA